VVVVEVPLAWSEISLGPLGRPLSPVLPPARGKRGADVTTGVVFHSNPRAAAFDDADPEPDLVEVAEIAPKFQIIDDAGTEIVIIGRRETVVSPS
jgi:hypothetical protein